MYGPKADTAGLQDLLLRSDFDPMVSGPARERQARYASELAMRPAAGARRAGAWCVRSRSTPATCARSQHREAEARAVGTDGGISATAAGEAALVRIPYFIELAWAPYRGKSRSFADQCGTWPMPAYGMELYIPYFSSAACASEQAEGAGR